MKKPKYREEYYNKLCKKKDPVSGKTLIEVQFEQIGQFDEKVRTDEIAKQHPSVFKSPFRPCKYLKNFYNMSK